MNTGCTLPAQSWRLQGASTPVPADATLDATLLPQQASWILSRQQDQRGAASKGHFNSCTSCCTDDVSAGASLWKSGTILLTFSLPENSIRPRCRTIPGRILCLPHGTTSHCADGCQECCTRTACNSKYSHHNSAMLTEQNQCCIRGPGKKCEFGLMDWHLFICCSMAYVEWMVAISFSCTEKCMRLVNKIINTKYTF